MGAERKYLGFRHLNSTGLTKTIYQDKDVQSILLGARIEAWMFTQDSQKVGKTIGLEVPGDGWERMEGRIL